MSHELPKDNRVNPLDRLSWQRFCEGAMRRGIFPPQSQSATFDDCLVCATHHFFVIVGTGAFVPGYLIIVTKTAHSSLAAIPTAYYKEVTWLTKTMSDLVTRRYNKNVVCFEHGMCGCSNAENAHLHIMPVSRQATAADFKRAINQVLDHRGIGIADEIDRELQREFRSTQSNREVLTFEQLQQFPFDNYPNLGDRPQKYVYFKSPFADTSFLTHVNLGSQVGREIVFEVERHHDKPLRQTLQELLSGSSCYGQLPWRWQDFDFSENILETMHHLVEPLARLQNSGRGDQFGFRSYLESQNVSIEENQPKIMFSTII